MTQARQCSIYCFTNKINGKKYIGSTIQAPNIRYNQHIYNATHENAHQYEYPLYQAIRKYGLDSFTFDVIYQAEHTEEEIRLIEADYIHEFNTVSPNGYNQTDNTTHPINAVESYKKMSETKREKAKCVAQCDEDNHVLNVFRSIADCSELTGVDEKKIGACCRGERKTTDGYHFYWLDENDNLIIPEYKRDTYKGAVGTTQIQSTNRQVAKIDKDTSEILAVYDSIALAARENSCDNSGISKVCNGKRNMCGGFKWKYIDNK